MTATATSTQSALDLLATATPLQREIIDAACRSRIWTEIERMAEAAPDCAVEVIERAMKALTPETATVGDGATKHLYSDSHAHTIVEVNRNGKQIVLQRDKATRTNRDKDTFEAGGFFGHTENPDGQKWAYERDESAEKIVANWSAKKRAFFVGGPTGMKVTTGRHEHYDYNF
jgi:hypothetical protein